ncbi:multicopper oxidase family protein [Spongiibacter sp. KMU-166]|uniref:Multicopper oxidase family protein n=1 Tax=Spongiibacter thalassae TaxID=2721624 RepID=A0ABX1GFY1_9GAMM|nr:multicopper oxidase family protein [Spongiibacter thalassae]NKI17850.1 multicopper oxidase family protein [Spongiibacter thalassae]
MLLNRRGIIKNGLLLSGACALPRFSLAMARPTAGNGPEGRYILRADYGSHQLVADYSTEILGFNGQFPAPVIRVKQGEVLRVRFENHLNEASTIHWHGIRLPIDMDGVPGISQAPVAPGESFDYEFRCADAGTFWYHPHINSIRQLGMGMVGVLIVEEKAASPYEEHIIGLKDWRLDRRGGYLPLSIPREAARDGTLGTINTVNGRQRPTIEIGAGQLVRLRIANMDNTRVYRPSIDGVSSRILSLDGSPLTPHRPFELTPLGAGMRMDLAFQAPDTENQEFILADRKGRFNIELCRLKTVARGAERQGDTVATIKPENLPTLPPNPIPQPDLHKAESLSFVFEWQGALSPTGKDGKVDHSFWLINRRAWGDHSHEHLPEPLATLERGKTYIVDLHNATPHHHPIHLHGMIFTVLTSDKRAVIPYQSDTILLEKNERARIAFVADNPGRWMFHCHVIEHMKTGLMGYLAVV